MGELIVTEFMTLDGIAQAPGGPEEDREDGFAFGGWQAPLIDAESGGLVFERAKSMDALLLGRRTYDIFAGYWPTAPAEMGFTQLLNRIPRYVATRTLKGPLGWEGARVLGDDGDAAKGTGDGDGDGGGGNGGGDRLAEDVAALKARHAEVHVIGSLNLVQALLALGLVDRLRLWVYPVVLGSGKRVFEGGAAPSALRLTESRVFPNGSLQLEYERAGDPTVGDLTDPDATV